MAPPADGGDADSSMDLPLARTAASLEKLAVDTYTTAAGSGLVTTKGIGEAATPVPRATTRPTSTRSTA